MLPINYLAVLVAALAAFIIGFLMHGPIAGKLWMRLADIHPTGNEKMSDMYGKMFWNLAVNIVTAYALAVVYLFASTSPYASTSHIWTGIVCGFLVWLGFLATATSIDTIWMGKPFTLWFFEFWSSFIVMLSMGAIIGAFG
jgi:uncharacterized membrane protein YagU involved in acid resistance